MSLRLSFSELSFVPRRIFIGFSGGLDSRVLFDLLSQDAFVKQHQIELILVHVNHHVQAAADEVQAFATRIAMQYQTPIEILHVTETCPRGESLEAFLREARYALFDSLLTEQDVFALAHQADDQAETFLINLMRGAGLQGLSAMSAVRTQGSGVLWRPLLGYLRRDLEAYARAQSLEWLDDVMNQDPAFDRVFLRQEVLPLLNSRWVRATELLCRTSDHIRSANEVMQNYLYEDLHKLVVDERLNLKALKTYEQAKGLLLLKMFLDQKKYRLSTVQLKQIYQDFVLSDNDAHPLFEYQDVSLRRVKGWLWFEG